jgi:hypothetical protein
MAIFIAQGFAMRRKLAQIGRRFTWPGKAGWALVIALITVFFTPYLLPGHTVMAMGSYPALPAVPVLEEVAED